MPHFRSRPGPNLRRAVLFPLGERRPRPQLTWVAIEPDAPGWDGHDRPLLDDALKMHAGETGYIPRTVMMIRGNALRSERLNDHTIEVTLRDDDWIQPPINQSTNRVGGNAWVSWRGPLVVMAKEGAEFDPKYYSDVSLDDFRDVVEYLRWFREGHGSATDGVGKDDHFGRMIRREKGGKVLGVRVNCEHDRQRRNGQRLEAVSVPRRHPLFHEEGDDPSDLSERIGFPICGKVYAKGGKSLKGVQGSANEEVPVADWTNPTIEGLFMQFRDRAYQKTGEWGGAHERWQGELGSVLLVRRGGQPLSVTDVSNLDTFCQEEILPFREQEQGFNEATARATPEGFQEWINSR